MAKNSVHIAAEMPATVAGGFRRGEQLILVGGYIERYWSLRNETPSEMSKVHVRPG
jgi:hypothetical protein